MFGATWPSDLKQACLLPRLKAGSLLFPVVPRIDEGITYVPGPMLASSGWSFRRMRVSGVLALNLHGEKHAACQIASEREVESCVFSHDLEGHFQSRLGRTFGGNLEGVCD